MSDAGARNPFQPGHGGRPPYLAGREPEQALFREVFRDLRSGAPIPRSFVLYGPRGNGKTALLRWVEREAEAGGEFDAYWLTGDDTPEPADLVRSLPLDSWLEEIAPESASVGGVGGSRWGSVRPLLAEALEARAQTKPLLLLLDEAQVLENGVGRWILNAAQRAGGTGPFLMALAGTPDIWGRFSEMGAGFMDRAEHLPIDRLDGTAAAEAVRRPLAEDGIAIEDDALERIVRESDGYPFFVQLWGQAVWDRVRGSSSPSSRVTMAVVEDAAGVFERERNDYYSDRFDELEQRGLLPAAREAALAFRDRQMLPHADFREAIRRSGSGGDRSSEIETALERLGFAWMAKGTLTWEPGIPGLVDYLLEREPPSGEADAGGR